MRRLILIVVVGAVLTFLWVGGTALQNHVLKIQHALQEAGK